MDGHGVVLFYSTHAVFRLEKALRNRGVACKPIPTPRHLSSDCGTALRFAWLQREVVEAEIERLELDIEAIHRMCE